MLVATLWILPAHFTVTWLWKPFITLWYGIMGIPLCLVISIFSYTKIFLTLRQHNTQIHNNVQQTNQINQLNLARNKKAVSSAIWLHLTLVARYLPCGVASAFFYSWRRIFICFLRLGLCNHFSALNSSINPIRHCWKLEEIRQTVKDTIRQVPCGWFSTELRPVDPETKRWKDSDI